MSLKFYEALKSILYDVESFLTVSLKDVKLPKSVASDKDSILKKLTCLQADFPQLKTVKVENTPTDSMKDLSSTKQPELRDKTKASVDSQARSAKVDSEIYDDIGQDNISESQDPYKPPSSVSDGSESVSDSPITTSISVKDAMSTCSHSGFLVRGTAGKSKLDLKQILGGLFGGKKFCVVGGGLFYIFDKGNSKKQNGSFPLRGYEARSSVDPAAAGSKGKDSFWFELVNPGQKSHVFAADSQEEMNKWISVLNLEALKMPDPRMSVICGEDDALSDYEDPPSPAIQTSKPPTKKPSVVKPKKGTSITVDDDELYDNVQTAAERIEPDEELYEDTGSGNNNLDEEIYEDFDEFVPPPPVTKPPAAKPALPSNARPVPSVPSRAPAPPPTTSTMATSAIYSVPPMGENEYENMFYGKWDCRADDDNELAFKRGDIVMILSREYERFGWWVGRLNGSVGLVPREYMTPAYELVSG